MINGKEIQRIISFDKQNPKDAGTNAVEKMLMYSLVRYLKPKRILEVGVSAGHMTVWLAKAVKDNKVGRLTSVDRFQKTDGGKATSPAKVKNRLKKNGLLNHVDIIKSDSLEYMHKIDENWFDFVLIDGGHKYDQAYADIVQAMRISKFVAVHDTNQKAYVTVRKACTDIGNGMFIDGFRGWWLWQQ